ncbi:hypothetical protein IMSAGC002_04017 [Lachnospiraceae bacterium]|nr:hypothetical protein IMSAGC002_04017 [Lachnospiraceae bacterium]
MVIIFFIRSHINNFIRNARINRIGFINLTVWCLYKTILINPCIACQRVNQTDVRTFRRLNRAHSPIMGIVNITHLKSRTVPGQTAWPQCGKTSLVGQLTQRIILIHKLGKLGRTKKFLHRSLYWFDVNQYLRGNLFSIMSCHPFTDYPFQPGQTDPVLVLEQFTYRPDAPVAQMVNIIRVSDAVFQVNIIIYGSNNIFLRNVLRYQFMHVLLYGFCQFFRVIAVIIQNLRQNRIINQFRDSQFPGVAIHKIRNIHHHIGKNLNIFLFRLYINIGNRCILDSIRQFRLHLCSGLCQYLPCRCIHHIFCQHMASYSILKCKLFIEFISSDFCQIISSGVKKHCGN